MTTSGKKGKLLYVLNILQEKSDAEHPITREEIINGLKAYGISAERKSIYTDIDELITYGVKIEKEKRGKNFYYYISERQFNLAELKLLVDSIQSARFITEKKSKDLIKKLETMGSKHEATQLQRQVFIADRVKAGNEKILENIDVIHRAIAENRKIKFQYTNWDINKKLVAKHDGKYYELNPWALTLAEEYYYLVCYDEKENNPDRKTKYFRVDKMQKISIMDEKRLKEGKPTDADIADYERKRFRMFDGEEYRVKLKCDNEHVGVIIDRFGQNVMLHPCDENHFTVNVDVAVSNQFFAWVLSMNDFMEIISPAEVVDKAKVFIKTLAEKYNV